jgi:hypothetical protein
MSKFIANLMVLAMATTFVLMAMRLDGVLQFFGYFWGALMGIAVAVNWSRVSKN